MNTENWSKFIQNVAEKVTQSFERNSFIGIKEYVKGNLNDWESIALTIAVIGPSGVGKSSFINTLLDLKADDEGAAKVGEGQCIKEPKSYSRGDYPNLKIWDLPEVGMTDFPKERYLEQIQFKRYDFFIILSAAKFTQMDIWFAKTMSLNGKAYYFIRTNIDTDIVRAQTGQRNIIDANRIVEKIYTDCTQGLSDGGLPDQTVYVVANYKQQIYDFDLLCTILLENAPDFKREAMAMTLSVFTDGVIGAKAEIFRRRICKVAIASAVGSTMKVSGLDIVMDVECVSEEAVLYRKTFGLHEEELKRVAYVMRVPVQDLTASLDLSSTTIELTADGIASFCMQNISSNTIENTMKQTIPILEEGIVADKASFWSTGICLETLLNLMVQDALTIQQRLREVLESYSE